MATRETDEIDVDELLSTPEETGDYDCTVPEEYAGTPEEDDDILRAPRPAQPIPARCSREFRAVRRSGARDLSQIGLVVIHCTQSNSARSSAQWFANPAAQGSAHIVVDDFECYRTLEDDDIPWGAKGANTRGFHIEIAGWAQWNRQRWLNHERGLRRAAFKGAFHADKFRIPIRLLTVAQLRSGQRGFATHHLCCQAFTGTHTDPGSHFPIEQFLNWTRDYAREL
jgi:hypothetical protein